MSAIKRILSGAFEDGMNRTKNGEHIYVLRFFVNKHEDLHNYLSDMTVSTANMLQRWV